MNTSRSPNDLGRQAGAPRGGRPAPRTSKQLSRCPWRASDAAVPAVTLAAVLALVGCGASSGSTSVSTSTAGTWVGTGTVTNGGQGQLFAVYLDLTTGANGQITGTGSACVVAGRDSFTITGAPGSSNGRYTMEWTKTDPTGTTHTLHATAHVSGSQMTLSGSDPSFSPPLTNRATLMPGSMNDYNAKCASLPTPTPSP